MQEVRRSLDVADTATAKLKLADLHKQANRSEAGTAKVTLADLCDRYMATVQNQSAKTLKRKRHIAARLEDDFPGGADVPAGRVIRSQVQAWLASYHGYRGDVGSLASLLDFALRVPESTLLPAFTWR